MGDMVCSNGEMFFSLSFFFCDGIFKLHSLIVLICTLLKSSFGMHTFVIAFKYLH